MDFPTLTQVMTLIRPGCRYNVRGEKLEWLDTDQSEPTESELAAGLLALQLSSYQKDRALAYPPLQDFADAYVHLANGDKEPMMAYVAKCNAVKAAHPKPN